MKIDYSQEFFEALKKIVDKHPHICQQCGVADGERVIDKKGNKKKVLHVVRLALKNPQGLPNVASNIAMFCLKCRKPGAEWREPKKMRPKDLPSLFEIEMHQ